MFKAKNAQPDNGNSRTAWLLGGLGVLLLAVGGSFYSYLNSLQQPDLVLARPAATQSVPVQPSPPAETASANNAATNLVPPPAAQGNPAASPASIPKVFEESAPAATDEAVPIRESGKSQRQSKATKSQQLAFGAPMAGTDDAAVKVTRNQPAIEVSPNLLSAYQAFMAGDDVTAQRLYRLVLQGDVRNVDALLGMAAIASRQGRHADAGGWYGKVLEVEPRNSIAQAAMISAVGQTDPIGSESRIKNLLARQPEAAHLYAALGNLYAEQNQWPSAQQAYFQAQHYDANNADYAFNLAVSLDHLGKSALALQYYKRTQELLSKSGVSSIDRTQLESRIMQLQ